MTQFTTSLLAGGCLIFYAVPASAETRQFANMVYEVPAGWETNGKSENRFQLHYHAEDGGCDSCRILLDPGAADRGPIGAWRDKLAAPGEEMSVMGEPKIVEDTIGDWPLHVLMRQIDDDGQSMFQAFFAIDLPGRNELVIFEGSARDRETFNRSLATMNADLVPMLDEIKFVSEGAEPVLGPPQAGDLEGPWFGTAIRNRYNGFSGGMELVIDKRLMTFYPDGRFYHGIPPGGAAPLDVERLGAGGETGLGNYIVSGDDIELRYVDGDVSHMQMTSDSTIDAGRATIHPTPFAPDGYRFEGAIRSASYTALGAGISGGASSEHSTVFRKDGTYTDSSFTGLSATFDSGVGFAGTSETPERTGRYEVADGLITLTPPEGEPTTAWIVLEGGGNVLVGGQPVFSTDDE